eukprot:jgi/Ulvmu1/8855/UM049_0037.1
MPPGSRSVNESTKIIGLGILNDDADLSHISRPAMEMLVAPSSSAVARRARSQTVSHQEAPPAKRARATAGMSIERTFSAAAETQADRRLEPLRVCDSRLRLGVQAGTNSATSDDPVPDLFVSTAETTFSSHSDHDGCVEEVGERNPSQLEEFKWLKRRLGKLMEQQAKLVQRRTALRKEYEMAQTAAMAASRASPAPGHAAAAGSSDILLATWPHSPAHSTGPASLVARTCAAPAFTTSGYPSLHAVQGPIRQCSSLYMQ